MLNLRLCPFFLLATILVFSSPRSSVWAITFGEEPAGSLYFDSFPPQDRNVAPFVYKIKEYWPRPTTESKAQDFNAIQNFGLPSLLLPNPTWINPNQDTELGTTDGDSGPQPGPGNGQCNGKSFSESFNCEGVAVLIRFTLNANIGVQGVIDMTTTNSMAMQTYLSAMGTSIGGISIINCPNYNNAVIAIVALLVNNILALGAALHVNNVVVVGALVVADFNAQNFTLFIFLLDQTFMTLKLTFSGQLL